MPVGKQWREVLVTAGVWDSPLPWAPPRDPHLCRDPNLCQLQAPALLPQLRTGWAKGFSIPSPFYFPRLK